MAAVHNAERGLSPAGMHERTIVGLAALAVCRAWSLDVIKVEHPEDRRPVSERPVDALVATNGETLAVEHTVYMSYRDEIADGRFLLDLLRPITERLSGTLPTPGHYELHVEPRAVLGHKKADLGAIEAWIVKMAPTLTVARPGYPGHSGRGEPPEVPFPMTLYRWEASEWQPDGAISPPPLGIDLRCLPDLNLEQTLLVFDGHLPKLEEHGPRGGRTLLVLEVPGMQLVNTFTAADAVRGALAARPDLSAPDAIVLVYTAGNPWWLEWIKDADRWHPSHGREFKLLA